MSEYNDAEFRQIINEIHRDVKEIRVQTTMTNGRVRALEVWKGFITGGLVVLGVLVGYLIKLIRV